MAKNIITRTREYYEMRQDDLLRFSKELRTFPTENIHATLMRDKVAEQRRSFKTAQEKLKFIFPSARSPNAQAQEMCQGLLDEKKRQWHVFMESYLYLETQALTKTRHGSTAYDYSEKDMVFHSQQAPGCVMVWTHKAGEERQEVPLGVIVKATLPVRSPRGFMIDVGDRYFLPFYPTQAKVETGEYKKVKQSVIEHVNELMADRDAVFTALEKKR